MKTNRTEKFVMFVVGICLLTVGCGGQPLSQRNISESAVPVERSTAALKPQIPPTSTAEVLGESLPTTQDQPEKSATIYQPSPAVDSEIALDVVPLDMQSSSAEIQDRIMKSQSLWRTVWLDGLIIWYPPEGEQAPPQTFRGQVWLDQSGMKFRSLIGIPGGDPASAKISDGEAIFEFDPRYEKGSTTNLPTFAKEGINLAGIVGSPLSELLFSGSLAQRGGNYVPISIEKIAGRPALVVDWRYDGVEQPVDRFWVDAQTGVFLRMQHFGKAGGEVVYSDIEFTQIFYNLDFSGDLFQLPLTDIPVFLEAPDKVSEVPRQPFDGAESVTDS